MVPTICSGRSAATAARKRAPAERVRAAGAVRSVMEGTRQGGKPAGNCPEVHNLIDYRASRIWGKVSIEHPARPEPLWRRKFNAFTVRTQYFVSRKTGGIIPLRSRYGLTPTMPRKTEATAGTR